MGWNISQFQEACLARGLLQDDAEWKECLEDACHMQTGSSLRSLFATILKDCHPAQPRLLWDQFKGYLCDDLEHYLHREKIVVDPTQEQVEDIMDYT